jgi:hypothetical protein
MDQARRIDYPDDDTKVLLPCEYFGMIGGTDTGGCVHASQTTESTK